MVEKLVNCLVKLSDWIRRAALALFASGLIWAANIQAQPRTNVTIRVVPGVSRLLIEGTIQPRTVWSFRDSYAGVLGLGGRIEELKLFDAQGIGISVRQIAPGHFESASSAHKFKYEVNAAPPARAPDAALISWLNAEHGVLMLGDLLPISELSESQSRRISLRVELPPGWIASSAENSAQNIFEIDDPDRAVVIVGKGLRSTSRAGSETQLMLVTDGDWAFKDNDAMDLAARILKAHSEIAGPAPCKQTALFLLPFPSAAVADRWNAQTRGCSVSLLMGKHPSRVAALSQLGNALTHELFHLWIPNGLALQGDYDWFYEGFTVYQAARTAVRLDLLTFADFLNAMGRAYDGFSASQDSAQLSLIEASKRRWTSGASGVYSKAMLIAFLYDLNLRYQSKGKHSVDDVYRDIFRSRKTGDQSGANRNGEDGNAVVTAALSRELDGQNFVQRFIVAPVSINLQKELSPFGLRVERFGFRTRITADDKLTKRQRDLLRELGYNDRAR